MRKNISKGDVTQKEIMQIVAISFVTLLIYWLASKLIPDMTQMYMYLLMIGSMALSFIAVSAVSGDIKPKNMWIAGVSAGVLRGVLFVAMIVLFTYLIGISSFSYSFLWLTTFATLVFAEFLIDPIVLKIK